MQSLINNNDVINLTKDFTAKASGDTVEISGSKIINGNSHVLNGNGKTAIFKITGGDVVLNDIVLVNGKSSYGGAVDVSNSNSLRFNNITFENNHASREGGAVYIDKGNSISFLNCDFLKNTAGDHGGAIYTTTYLDITNCIFNSNKVNIYGFTGCYGGAIYARDNLKIMDSKFAKNFALDDGGAIYTAGSLDIIGSLFDSNKVWANGGAIYAEGVVFADSSTFTSNKAIPDDDSPVNNNYGGAIYCKNNVDVVDSLFKFNFADVGGGAICSKNNVDVKNSIFNFNSAKSKGGAIYTDCVGSAIINATFEHNYVSDGDGGALYINKASVFTIKSSSFVSNYANAGDGGAIYSDSSSTTITLSESIFSDNYANNGKLRRMGGAIYFVGSLKVSNSTFLNNWAENQGGAIYCKETITFGGKPSYFIGNIGKKSSGGAVFTSKLDSCSNVVFIGNKANGDGGALYVNNACTMTLSNCYFSSNFASGDGGAIYTDSRKSRLILKNNVFYANKADEGQSVYNSGWYDSIAGNLWGNIPIGC